MNWISIVIAALVAAAVVLAIRSIHKKGGGCSCGGGDSCGSCAGCPKAGSCGKKTEK